MRRFIKSTEYNQENYDQAKQKLNEMPETLLRFLFGQSGIKQIAEDKVRQ